jgi:hypothetical protein
MEGGGGGGHVGLSAAEHSLCVWRAATLERVVVDFAGTWKQSTCVRAGPQRQGRLTHLSLCGRSGASDQWPPGPGVCDDRVCTGRAEPHVQAAVGLLCALRGRRREAVRVPTGQGDVCHHRQLRHLVRRRTYRRAASSLAPHAVGARGGGWGGGLQVWAQPAPAVPGGDGRPGKAALRDPQVPPHRRLIASLCVQYEYNATRHDRTVI